jgi:hypothetical protein
MGNYKCYTNLEQRDRSIKLMASSPTYNWPEPDNTDLVKNGALAIRTLGNAIDTTMATMTPKSLVDAKGDLIAASANDTPARLAVGANGETLVADSSTSTGLRYSPANAVGNPVLNSAMQVWQRGTSFSIAASSGTSYTADRWQQNGTAAGQALTISRQTTSDTTNLPFIQYALRYQRNSGQTGTSGLSLGTAFETINSIPFAGKTITLSFYARAGANYSAASSGLNVIVQTGTGTDQNIAAGWTGYAQTVNQTPTLTTTWQRFTYSGTVPTTATQIGLNFIFTPTGTAGAADFYEITGVQVDTGSVALPFRTFSATLQGELAACQRYYYKISNGNGSPLGLCMGETTNLPIAVAVLPVTMRTSPTLDATSGTNYYWVRTANNFNNFNSFTLETTSPTFATFYSTGTIVSGAGGRFGCNSTSSYVAFSAEL